MSEMFVFSCIMVLSVFISSLSQMMLKKSSQTTYSSHLREYLNPLVIIAYTLFFGCTFLSMYALKVVPLSFSPILESSGYIFVTLMSYFFFKEKVTRRQICGIMLITSGIVVSSLFA